MLPRNRRLPSKEMKRKKGEVFHSPSFLASISPIKTDTDKTTPKTKFGVIVSRKIDTRSPVRHREKRRIHEIIQSLLPNINDGFKVIISLKKGVRNASFVQLKSEIETVFSKSGVLS